MISGLRKTGRFIRMDFEKWLNPKICSGLNTSHFLEDGKIYELIYLGIDNIKDHYLEDSKENTRYVQKSEIEVLEVSLSEALIEMSRERDE